MTPKEKAKELYNKMYLAVPTDPLQEDNEHKATKQCALIAVEYQFETINKLTFTYNIEDEWFDSIMNDEVNYWQEVKKEIEKL